MLEALQVRDHQVKKCEGVLYFYSSEGATEEQIQVMLTGA